MATNGTKPPGSAEKGLGEIVTDISQKIVLLVKQEIELLKVEMSTKFSRIAKGAAFFAVAGVLAVFMLIWFFHFLALGIADWTGLKPYVGYAIVTFILLIGVVVLALIGYRSIKKGTPPTPELSIEEAKKTVAVLEEARH